MRKIEIDMNAAILQRRNRICRNTEVRMRLSPQEGFEILLHGNRIIWTEKEVIYASTAGFSTLTTRSRINAFCRRFCPETSLYNRGNVTYLVSQIDMPGLPKGTARSVGSDESFKIGVM